MDILLLIALIWGYNNQPKDVDPIAPVGTTFNQAAGFECQSNCTPATSTTVEAGNTSATTTTVADIIAELEAMPVTTTVTATTTSTGTGTSTSTSTGT